MSGAASVPGDDVLIRPASWVSWVPGSATITLFDERDGSYHALNRSASLIWTALGDGGSVGGVAALLAARFPGMAQAVKSDVADLVAEALRLGLLVTD